MIPSSAEVFLGMNGATCDGEVRDLISTKGEVIGVRIAGVGDWVGAGVGKVCDRVGDKARTGTTGDGDDGEISTTSLSAMVDHPWSEVQGPPARDGQFDGNKCIGSTHKIH